MTTAKATITLGEARSLLERGRLLAATDERRPVLHTIRLTISEGTVRAMAADGFALMVQRVDAASAEGDGDMLLDIDVVAGLLKTLPRDTKKNRDDEIDVTIDGDRLAFDDYGITIEGIGGQFPDINRLMPRVDSPGGTGADQINIAAKYLERAGKFARLGERLGGEGIVRFNMPESAKQPMVLSVRDSKRSRAVMVIMPMFADAVKLSELIRDILD
ncbi:hypothetical protein LCGC14_1023090 [marine sediment metagenome]|uniref:Uncharacterized protein n=1 Tax=marine sediment metagenome TaxID=412755 RepID=A0A0F9R2U1_9ZZZZ